MRGARAWLGRATDQGGRLLVPTKTDLCLPAINLPHAPKLETADVDVRVRPLGRQDSHELPEELGELIEVGGAVVGLMRG